MSSHPLLGLLSPPDLQPLFKFYELLLEDMQEMSIHPRQGTNDRSKYQSHQSSNWLANEFIGVT